MSSAAPGPRVGITTGVGASWSEGGDAYEPYAEAVRDAGAVAVRLDPGTLGREALLLGELDGILFSGGRDIHLDLYPNPPQAAGLSAAELMELRRMEPEPERDRYELPLLQAAVERDVPVLGICRGCQVLQVALGGQLVLDIPSEIRTEIVHQSGPPPERPSSGHRVRIVPGSQLAGLLPPERFTEVNSRHHQAVLPESGGPARVVAWCAEDDVAEAIEVPGRRWAIGVQWHPEHRKDQAIRELYRPLFRAFVEACERTR